MASTISLQNSINWAKPFLFYKPLTIGVSNEPALSSANLIQQTIVGAPFRWPWNRTSLTFTCTANIQDYNRPVINFGFIEKATAAFTGDKTFEIEVRNGLGDSNDSARPRFISVQVDDNAGNVSFRLLPVPEKAYTITIIYQKKVPLFTDPSQVWTIPDQYSYLYQHGFMALMMMFSDDPRWQVHNGKFVSHLLGASEGLTETQRNLFLSNWYAITGQTLSDAQKIQQGNQSRGV
jgi:hypothetical protein